MKVSNLTRYRDKGKYGYRDEAGNCIIQPIFMEADEFERGTARVLLDGKWGYIKEDGSWLIEPSLTGASPFSGELARVRKGFFYGFINSKGEWFIEPKLLSATNFENDCVAIVEDLNSKYAFISNKGNMITDFSLDHLEGSFNSTRFMSDNRIRAFKGGKYGFLDPDGNWVIPPIYESAFAFAEGRTFVSQSPEHIDSYDLIDLDGNLLLKSIGLKKFNIGFNDGLAIVSVNDELDKDVAYVIKKYGVIDRDGHWIVSPVFDYISKFENGFAVVSKDGKKGIIDREGNVIIDNVYDSIKFDCNYFKVENNKKVGCADHTGKVILPLKYDNCYVREDGFVTFKKKKGYGFADLNGKEIIKPSLEKAPAFDADLPKTEESPKSPGSGEQKEDRPGNAEPTDSQVISDIMATLNIRDNDILFFNRVTRCSWAKVKRKWGYYDYNTGRWLIEPKYDDVDIIDDDCTIMKVKQNGKWGVIDCDENMLVPPASDSKRLDEVLKQGLILIKSEGKAGYYDALNNRWALPLLFDTAQYVDNNLFIVKHGDKFALADAEGNIYDDKWYDDIFQGPGVLWVKEEGKYGVMEKTRSWIVPPTFDWIDLDWRILFNKDGIIRVKIDSRMALADTRGQILGGRTYQGMYPYNKGYFTVIERDKYGLIDKKGNLVIDTKFENTEPFFHGLALVRNVDKKYGYIGTDGEWAVLPRFDWAESFKPNHGVGILKYARAEKDGKYGLIDRKGNWVIEPKFERIGNVQYIMTARENGKYGYIDLTGAWIVPPVYMEAEEFCNGYGRVLGDDYRYLFVDATGKTYKRKPD